MLPYFIFYSHSTILVANFNWDKSESKPRLILTITMMRYYQRKNNDIKKNPLSLQLKARLEILKKIEDNTHMREHV